VRAGGRELAHASVFSEVPPGTPFWYGNSIGLVELAANQASAAALLGLGVGDPVVIAS
jgi:S-adenosylmethionine hydrolase